MAIARALAMQPKVMLFDEPTSALDPEMINEVLDVMTALAKDGMTMIVITHEMGFARRAANRVVFMADGEIVEEAPPNQFFDSPQSDRARDFLSKVLTPLAVFLHNSQLSVLVGGPPSRGSDANPPIPRPVPGGLRHEVAPYHRGDHRRGVRPVRLW